MLGCQTRAFEWQSSGYSSMVEHYTNKVGAGGSIPPIRAKCDTEWSKLSQGEAHIPY